MKIAVCGMFQNAASYLERYVCQVSALRGAAPQHDFSFILAEGDSTDGETTWRKLHHFFSGQAFKRVHGGQIYGPIDVTQRWLQISFVMDGCFERVIPEHEAVIWVESDLIWEPPTLLKLLEHIQKPGVDAATSMIFMKGVMYDIWGLRKDGIHFVGNPPYHPSLTGPSVNGLYLVNSCGGCVAMRGDVARRCRCRPPSLAMVGFCADVRAHGYKIWLDPILRVEHPPR